ncbi:hypothetical protein QQZ08_003705 [Neonectria magnoliae]|uniref:Uncharacterized protein n=1 Tax=Neonectria magnoliae TaxID=2732573 RepID=A0ABR1IA24_9HYPO
MEEIFCCPGCQFKGYNCRYCQYGKDLIDAIILPIFKVEESLQSMEEVVKMAKEIKAAQAKEFILYMLSTVFFVIGAVGGALASAGLASLGRVLVLIGEAGGTALGIEGVVSDPTTAPVLIFGLIMSGRGIRDVSNVARAARIRRATPTWEVEKSFVLIGEMIAMAVRLCQYSPGSSLDLDHFEMELYLSIPEHCKVPAATHGQDDLIHHCSQIFYFSSIIYSKRKLRGSPLNQVQTLVEQAFDHIEALTK